MISYHRLPDDLTLDVRTPENADTTGAVSVGTDYEIITYNIGFGAYTPDYSFFMDGGKSSVAASKESVLATVSGAGGLAAGYDPDFMILKRWILKPQGVTMWMNMSCWISISADITRILPSIMIQRF